MGDRSENLQGCLKREKSQIAQLVRDKVINPHCRYSKQLVVERTEGQPMPAGIHRHRGHVLSNTEPYTNRKNKTVKKTQVLTDIELQISRTIGVGFEEDPVIHCTA